MFVLFYSLTLYRDRWQIYVKNIVLVKRTTPTHHGTDSACRWDCTGRVRPLFRKTAGLHQLVFQWWWGLRCQSRNLPHVFQCVEIWWLGRHSIWVISFVTFIKLFSKALCPVDGSIFLMEKSSPISHQERNVSSQNKGEENNFIMVCSDASHWGEKWTQTMPGKSNAVTDNPIFPVHSPLL